jgi:hypothetical protein
VPEIKEVIEELRFISDRLSTQARMVALGVLAISWTILIGESAFLRKLSEELGKKLLLISALSIFVLLVDFLQYVVGYIFVNRTLKKAEAESLAETDFDRTSFMFKLRSLFFWAKQVVLIATLVIFLVVLIRYVFS